MVHKNNYNNYRIENVLKLVGLTQYPHYEMLYDFVVNMSCL